jgi:hypothetical protein
MRDGRIGTSATDEPAKRKLDAAGLTVAPIKSTTHALRRADLLGSVADAVEPARRHSVIGGNCGSPWRRSERTTPLRPPHDGEGESMPLTALENGPQWNWSELRRYLARLEDASASTPLSSATAPCAASSWARAPSAPRRPKQIEAMATAADRLPPVAWFLVDAGPASDGDDNPCHRAGPAPRRCWRSPRGSRAPGTTLEIIVDVAVQFSDVEINLSDLGIPRRQPADQLERLGVSAGNRARHEQLMLAAAPSRRAPASSRSPCRCSAA